MFAEGKTTCALWFVPIKGDGKTPDVQCFIVDGTPSPDPPDPTPSDIKPLEIENTMLIAVNYFYTFDYDKKDNQNIIKKRPLDNADGVRYDHMIKIDKGFPAKINVQTLEMNTRLIH